MGFLVVVTVPALFNTTAYAAVTSIAVIGLYIAYVTPVFLRRLNPAFQPGPWNLGRWSGLIGWIAVAWVVFIVILFVLPPVTPITVDTFNYAPIAVAVVAILSIVLWYAYGKRDFMNSSAEAEHLTKSADTLLDE